jgi:hypothetical protein
LNQEDINNLNRSIISNEIKAGIKSLPKKKYPGPDGLMAEFYQTFIEEQTPTRLKLFCEIEREGTLQNHSMKPVLHSSKNRKRTQKKRIIGQTLINLDAKILNTAKPNSTSYPKDYIT